MSARDGLAAFALVGRKGLARVGRIEVRENEVPTEGERAKGFERDGEGPTVVLVRVARAVMVGD